MLSQLVDVYRRAGGDPPFVDTGGAHGSPMEGYFWRLASERDRRVLVAMVGRARHQSQEPWGVAGIGAHPESTLVHEITAAPSAARDHLDVSVPGIFTGSLTSLDVAVGSGRLTARFARPVHLPGPLGGLGLGHLVPGLPTYWTPSLISADVVEGEASYGGETFSLEGYKVYVEKNWGSLYPSDWWWGQSFFDDDVSLVFAGGRIPILGLPLQATALVLQQGRRVTRFGPPFARVTSSTTGTTWQVRASGSGLTVDVDGEVLDHPPVALPVPIPAERRTEGRALEWLAGRMRVVVRRGSRLVLDSESTLAGLEVGLDAPHPVAE